MHVHDNKETRIETSVRDIPLKKRSLNWKNSMPLKKRPLHFLWLPIHPYSPLDHMTDFNQEKIDNKPSRDDGVPGNTEVLSSFKEEKEMYLKVNGINLGSVKQEEIDPIYGVIDAKPTTSELESCSFSPTLPNKSHWDLNTTIGDWGKPLADKGMYYAESGKHIESMEEINVIDNELLKLFHSPLPDTPLKKLCVTKESSPTTSCKTIKSETYKIDGGNLTMGNVENRDKFFLKPELCDLTLNENQTSGREKIIVGSVPCDLQLRIPNTDAPNCIIDEHVEPMSVSVIAAKDSETSLALTCTSILDSSLVSLSPKENSISGSGNVILGCIPCDLQLRIPKTADLNCNNEHVESISASTCKDAETCQVLTGTSILNSDSSVGADDLTDGVLDLDSSVKKICSSNSDFCVDEMEDGEVRDHGMKSESFSNVNICLVQDEIMTESCLEKEKSGYLSDHCTKDVVCETINENHTEVCIKKISNECNSALTAVEPNLNLGSNESSSRAEKKLSSSRMFGREFQGTRGGSCRDRPRGYEKDRNRDGFNRKVGYQFPVSRRRLDHNNNMEDFHDHRNPPSPEFQSEEFDRCSRISSEASFAVHRRDGRGNFLVEHRAMKHITPGPHSYVHRSRRCSISPDRRRIPLNIPYMRSPPQHRSPRLWSSPRRLSNEYYDHSELIPCRFERAESPVGVGNFSENPSFVSRHLVHQGMRQTGYHARPEGGRNFQRNINRPPPRFIGRRVDSEDRNFNGHRGFVHSRSVNHRNGHCSSNPRNFSRPFRYRMGSDEAFPHRGMQEFNGMNFSDDADDNSTRSKRVKR